MVAQVTLKQRDIHDPARVQRAVQNSEKLQALKLIKHLIDVGAAHLPRSVCLVLISMAEDLKSDDTTFRCPLPHPQAAPPGTQTECATLVVLYELVS